MIEVIKSLQMQLKKSYRPMNNSFELLEFLKEKKILENSPEFWWPSYGTVECLISTILTQNTKWENVEKSLDNLKVCLGEITLEKLINLSTYELINLIAPSGFKNQKSKRLKLLCQNIFDDFVDFETFKESVGRDWLLAQKGIGYETADSILCYVCGRDEMVVDSYTNRLLKSYGFEFESYDEIKQWLEFGINENYDKVITLYAYEISINKVYARFHGKIVEYMKNN